MTTTATTFQQYIELVNTVKAHDYRYFVLNQPAISDEEYDSLFFQLQQTEEQHPEWTAQDSPTQLAQQNYANGRRQVVRRRAMLSTEKAKDTQKVMRWMQSAGRKVGSKWFTAEWKYDGVSCSLVYQDGQLIEASEGKGTEGNDVLPHMQHIPSVPKHIGIQGRIEVRGEVIMPKDSLPLTTYNDCRSAAAGIMANVVPNVNDCTLLRFMPYQVEGMGMTLEASLTALYTDNGQWEQNEFYTVSKDDVESLVEKFAQKRDSLDFPVDGVVFKVLDTDQWYDLGQTQHHYKYAMAYKFPPQTVETVCTRIEITVGATGKRTPVCYFETVSLMGKDVQKASLGSERTAEELGIYEGARIIVGLANDVTPHVYGLAGGETTKPHETTRNPHVIPSVENQGSGSASEPTESAKLGGTVLAGLLTVATVLGQAVQLTFGLLLCLFGVSALDN